MIAQDHLSLLAALERLYERPEDPGFDAICAGVGIQQDDAQLADVIEADGRLRLRRRRPVTLERYLDALPGLTDRLDALDAAIDMAIRALVGDGATEDEAVQRIVTRHPDLERAVKDAAALADAVWSTTRLRTHVATPAPLRDLPDPFGPRMEDGDHRYELQDLLGEGSFGQVYLAVDRRLSDDEHAALVSIKVLTARPRAERERDLLIEEAAKARRINHPNVVRVLDRGVSDQDEDYIVHELVTGGDLCRFMRRRRRLPVAEAARLAAGIARGVHAAHMAGLVHCDLKPANVMLTESGEPKVADFGIAIRAADAEQPDRRTPGTGSASDSAPLGNIAFISPEQYRMEPGALTVPSDLYALGGILYWLITGALPNGGTAEQIEAAHARPGARTAPSPRALREDVDRDLDAICRRAMAQRPEDRHGSAAALADDLDAWRRREPIHWRHPSPARRLSLWVRRKPALAAATAIIAVLAVTGAALAVRNAMRRTAMELANEANRDGEIRMLDSIERIGRMVDEGMETEVFPALWYFEYLYGPTFMSRRVDWDEIWSLRVEATRQRLERLREAGGADHMEALLWESILAFWLVHDGDHAEAEPMLRDNLRRWRKHLDKDDPWLLQLEALAACAVVSRHVEGGGASDTELAQATTTLRAAEARLQASHRGAPIHEVVRRALQRITTD